MGSKIYKKLVGGMKRLRKDTYDLIHTRNRSEWLNKLYLLNWGGLSTLTSYSSFYPSTEEDASTISPHRECHIQLRQNISTVALPRCAAKSGDGLLHRCVKLSICESKMRCVEVGAANAVRMGQSVDCRPLSANHSARAPSIPFTERMRPLKPEATPNIGMRRRLLLQRSFFMSTQSRGRGMDKAQITNQILALRTYMK
jgi:hypothetical protein